MVRSGEAYAFHVVYHPHYQNTYTEAGEALLKKHPDSNRSGISTGSPLLIVNAPRLVHPLQDRFRGDPEPVGQHLDWRSEERIQRCARPTAVASPPACCQEIPRTTPTCS